MEDLHASFHEYGARGHSCGRGPIGDDNRGTDKVVVHGQSASDCPKRTKFLEELEKKRVADK